MEAGVTTHRVEQVIFDGLAEVGAERDAISREATFEDLDVDSLDLVELAQIVEDEYGIELKGEDVDGIVSVEQVVELIASRLP